MGLWSTFRDPKRIKKICQLLEIAWSHYPDQRLGQFLLNYVFGSIGRDSHIYHKEDDVLEVYEIREVKRETLQAAEEKE